MTGIYPSSAREPSPGADTSAKDSPVRRELRQDIIVLKANIEGLDPQDTAPRDVASALYDLAGDTQTILNRVDLLSDDRDELRDLLKDVLDLENEAFAIAGGPHFHIRRQKAWARVAEYFEP